MPWFPRFGGTVFERSGESYREAFVRTQNTYGGRLGIVRMFFPGLPSSWSSINSQVGDTPLLVSFHASPQQVLVGRYDSQLRAWFADAPRGHATRWAYFHEPEDDGVSPDVYRQAWRHINALANQAHNERLRATLILMCWTLEQNSGRSWRSYYPGSDVIDLLGFDCYNGGHRADRYRPPSSMFEDVVQVSRETGKPWGIAELGSVRVSGDLLGLGRAAWLRDAASFARSHGARFVSYFDSDVGTDYRLLDEASRLAWRSIVVSQWR